MNDIYTQGALDDVRALSDSVCTDYCTLYVIGSADNSQPTVDDEGGTSQVQTASYTNLPCRLDTDSKALIPFRDKSDIVTDKTLRYIYIPIRSLLSINYIPSALDEIETTAGHPLGKVIRYKVMEVDNETDEIDCQMLVTIL